MYLQIYNTENHCNRDEQFSQMYTKKKKLELNFKFEGEANNLKDQASQKLIFVMPF